ncbi:MAG: hypothetical protein ACRDGA_03030, partial [Bacteroidota bacterium]
MSKNLEVGKTTAISTDVVDLYDGADTGFENVRTDDIAIPFLRILQSLSPQVKKGADRIEGAEEGDILNTVTKAVHKSESG